MTVKLITLGCKVNQYESEAVKKRFEEVGYTAVFGDNADVFVVNSCTVTSVGDKKTRQTVHRIRRENPDSIIVLCGCFPQASKTDIPEADIITGTTERLLIPSLVEEFKSTGNRIFKVKDDNRHEIFEEMQVDGLSEHTRAYLKIEDGCDRFCTYCIVPYARGNVRSRSLKNIECEAHRLYSAGYREIILVGTNLSAYGLDLGLSLPDAVNAVSNAGIPRIRFGSLEPDLLTDEMLIRLSEFPQICPQFHISLQSGCEETLKRMKRRYTAKEYADICDKIKKYFPDAVFTTDIIVGFPNESEAEFKETCEFVKKIGFCHAHIFPYSKRNGTPAAEMTGQIEPQVKKERCKKLSSIVSEIKKEWHKSHMGKTVEVLVCEENHDGSYMGITANNLTVHFSGKFSLQNPFVSVIIENCEKDYCTGKVI